MYNRNPKIKWRLLDTLTLLSASLWSLLYHSLDFLLTDYNCFLQLKVVNFLYHCGFINREIIGFDKFRLPIFKGIFNREDNLDEMMTNIGRVEWSNKDSLWKQNLDLSQVNIKDDSKLSPISLENQKTACFGCYLFQQARTQLIDNNATVECSPKPHRHIIVDQTDNTHRQMLFHVDRNKTSQTQ